MEQNKNLVSSPKRNVTNSFMIQVQTESDGVKIIFFKNIIAIIGYLKTK